MFYLPIDIHTCIDQIEINESEAKRKAEDMGNMGTVLIPLKAYKEIEEELKECKRKLALIREAII